METVLVQINNNKAYKLLEDLEELNIIKVLKKSIKPQKQEKLNPAEDVHSASDIVKISGQEKTVNKQKLSEKYAGKLPADIADELQSYVTQSRNEWNKRSI